MSSNAAKKKTALKQFLQSGHRLLQLDTTERVLSSLNGHPLRLHVHTTPTVLSSASLLTAYIRNWLTRHRESVTNGTVKRLMSLADYKSPVWRYRLDQRPRQRQYAEVARQMKLEQQRLEILSGFGAAAGAAKERLATLQANLGKVLLTARLMKDEVSGSLHPNGELSSVSGSVGSGSVSGNATSNATSATSVTSNATSVAESTTETHCKNPLQSSLLSSSASSAIPKLRGFSIRLAGPRKGNRALTWERSVGAISTNSVDYVIAEEDKCQLPSKMGTFGLTVRIVYERVAERPLSGVALLKQQQQGGLFNGIDTYKPFLQ